jgi:hypothetical protein
VERLRKPPIIAIMRARKNKITEIRIDGSVDGGIPLPFNTLVYR